MLVVKPEEGASLARALGKHWIVLMMRHGVTVAGTSVRDCVFRSVYSARNAEYQVRALTIGTEIATLSPGETKLAGQISSKTTGLMRSWEYWSMRVGNEAAAPASVSRTGKSTGAKPTRTRSKARPKRAAKRRR
jgi:HCOMODA/2-hydroxy-3-carboxy-muconic semialdehyde decarboxylase